MTRRNYVVDLYANWTVARQVWAKTYAVAHQIQSSWTLMLKQACCARTIPALVGWDENVGWVSPTCAIILNHCLEHVLLQTPTSFWRPARNFTLCAAVSTKSFCHCFWRCIDDAAKLCEPPAGCGSPPIAQHRSRARFWCEGSSASTCGESRYRTW